MARNRDLDVLRGFAIIGTFLAHAPQFTAIPATIRDLYRFPAWGMGVDLFFVISGYLITKSLLKTLESKSTRDVLKDFWIKRVFRILPASIFWLLVASVVSLAIAFNGDSSGLSGTIRSFLAGLFNVSNVYWSYCIKEELVNSSCGGGANMAVWWSLSLEEQFYIFFPLVFLFFGRTATLVACAGLIIYFSTNERLFADLNWMMRLDGISYGVLLALFMERHGCQFRESLAESRCLRLVGFTCLTLTPLLGGLAYTVEAYNPLFFSLSVVCAAVCVTIASLDAGAFEIKWVGGALAGLGRISFSFYLCHESVLVIVANLKQSLVPHSGDTRSFVLILSASCVASTGAALVSTRFIENPMIAVGRAMTKSAPPRALTLLDKRH
ncbi:acyltransferase [Pararhizobium sp. BT-229]|uniref:acyltransferase family protein n=1 Tax=Pararhizobium sp. BT-229 TaxID=2986923 RepID=UPI0021F6A5CD|nr:acyltransferase [Pararhizobium sp. BT-229]MCV9963907.1 acyltransferase [Pararhizobium sp. BT-229]